MIVMLVTLLGIRGGHKYGVSLGLDLGFPPCAGVIKYVT